MKILKNFFKIFKFNKNCKVNVEKPNNITPKINKITTNSKVKISYKVYDHDKTLSINPKFHRTKQQEELSNNFSFEYLNQIDIYECRIYNSVTGASNSLKDSIKVDEKISMCKQAIHEFYSFKSFCASKGKGGELYFEDMWQHCHNSKNPDFSFITNIEDSLNYIINNYEFVKAECLKSIKKIEFKSHAINNILAVISSNEGILQKDIYRYFDNDFKSLVQSSIMELNKSNKIYREKHGNTFKLYISK